MKHLLRLAYIPKCLNHLASGQILNRLTVYVQASIYKQQQNFNEVIILNEQGRVADASTANVFAVVNNLLISPPNNEGGIDGVLRRVLVKLCKQNKIELQQAPLSLTKP